MRRLLLLPVLLLSAFGLLSSPAAAQTTATDSITAIVEEIESTGRFIDPGALPLADGVEAAIDRANQVGLAVAFPDPGANAEALAPAIDAAMRKQGSRYDSILVLTPAFVAAEVAGTSDVELNQAFDASDAGYANGGDAGAIDGFVSSITGEDPVAPDGSTATSTTPTVGSNSPTTETATETATDGEIGSPTTDTRRATESSGSGFPWFWAILAAIGGFFGLRYFSNKRRRRAAEQAAIEVDRHEIAEQLRNNADRVINLGDPVIATKNAALIALYEEASTTYQEVSLALPEATTAAEIDALDDRIDNAEWQLEVIAARLAGEPEPPSPSDRERAATPPSSTGPALGPNDSIFGPGPGGASSRSSSSRSSRSRSSSSRLPRPERQPRQRSSRGGGSGGVLGGLGGAMSGGLGGMLGSILGQILLGGGRPRTASRRTQRRSSSGTFGSSGPFGSGRSSRRSSGGSFPDPFNRTGRSSGRLSSGRSLGRASNRGSSRRASGSRARNTSTRRSGGSRRR